MYYPENLLKYKCKKVKCFTAINKLIKILFQKKISLHSFLFLEIIKFNIENLLKCLSSCNDIHVVENVIIIT